MKVLIDRQVFAKDLDCRHRLRIVDKHRGRISSIRYLGVIKVTLEERDEGVTPIAVIHTTHGQFVAMPQQMIDVVVEVDSITHKET